MSLVEESLPPFENVIGPNFLNLYSENRVFDSLVTFEIRIHLDNIEDLASQFEFLITINISIEHPFINFKLSKQFQLDENPSGQVSDIM